MHAAHSKHAELTPGVVKEDGSRDNSTAVSETKPQDRFPVKKEGRGSRTSEAQGLEAARTTEPAEPRLPKSSAPQVTSSPIKDPTIHIPDRSKLQRSEGPRYWPHDKPAEVGAQKSPRKEELFFVDTSKS
jgi:hypothetical protein